MLASVDFVVIVVTYRIFNFLKLFLLGVFCKYFIVGWQSRVLDLPKSILKPRTQKEKLFVGLCSTYLVCTAMLSKPLIENYKIILLSCECDFRVIFIFIYNWQSKNSILFYHYIRTYYLKVKLLLSWIIKLINELNWNN